MAERDLELVEIYRAKNLPEAHVIRLMMEREGIDVSISNETLQGIVGEIAMGWSTSPQVLVKQQDVEAARMLLESHVDHALRPDSPTDEESLKCFACGIVMDGNSVCSACGWSYGDEQVATPAAAIDHSESTPLNPAVDQLPDEENDLVDGGGGKTGTMPVLPAREVWLELAVVMSIGFVPHLINSLLPFQPSADVNPYWVVAVQFMPYSISSTFATLYIIRRSGEKWSEFGYGAPRFTDFVLGFVTMLIVVYFGGILQSAIADGKTSAESVIQSTHDFRLFSDDDHVFVLGDVRRSHHAIVFDDTIASSHSPTMAWRLDLGLPICLVSWLSRIRRIRQCIVRWTTARLALCGLSPHLAAGDLPHAVQHPVAVPCVEMTNGMSGNE